MNIIVSSPGSIIFQPLAVGVLGFAGDIGFGQEFFYQFCDGLVVRCFLYGVVFLFYYFI